MDNKKRIRLDFAEQESIDISIAYTPACSLYMAIRKGIEIVKVELKEMQNYREDLLRAAKEKGINVEKGLSMVQQNEEIATLVLRDSEKFLEDLSQVIKELSGEPKKPKIIIPPKPSWG